MLLVGLVVALVPLAGALQAQSDTGRARRNPRVGIDGVQGRPARGGDPTSIQARGFRAYIENLGQWDSTVRFVLRGTGLNTWVTRDGVVFDIYEASEPRTDTIRGRQPRPTRRRKGHVLRMRFEGADTTVPALGVEANDTYYNYFVGADESRWARRVRTYGRVVVPGIYSGIDLIHYLHDGSPRYDVVVRPGADPTRVRMVFHGSRGLAVGRDGELLVSSTVGDLVQAKPFAYQEVDGRRQEVPCSFRRRDSVRVEFSVGSYDTTLALVIDPLVYSTFAGGSADDFGHGLVMDSDESAYVVGYTRSLTYPTTDGAYDLVGDIGWDAFVTKFHEDGSGIVFSTFYGGSGLDLGTSIDVADAIVIAGNTTSGSLPGVDGADSTFAAGQDAFVVMLSMDGDSVYHATYHGGSMDDWTNGIAYASDQEVVLVGGTSSTDLVLVNALQQFGGGTVDGYIARFSSALQSHVFATYVGGLSDDIVDGLAVDVDDTIHVVGGTASSNFAVTTGAFDSTHAGLLDGFYRRYSSDGGTISYSTFVGGIVNDRAFAVDVDSTGAAYLAGFTASSSGFPVTPSQVAQAQIGGLCDAFVARFAASGALSYCTYLGGTGNDSAFGISADVSGKAYVCGVTTGGFPTSDAAFDSSFGGGARDGFFAVVDAAGAEIQFATYLGGSAEDRLDDVGVVWADRAVLLGSSQSPDFPVTSGAFQTSDSGEYDMTLTRFYLPPGSAATAQGLINDYFPVIAVDDCGPCVYVDSLYGAAPNGLHVGDRVVIMQMTGAAFVEDNSRRYGAFTTLNRAGYYEFATIASVTATVYLDHPVSCVQFTSAREFEYRPSQLAAVQLIRVPQYSDVQIVGGTLTAREWDGSTGGVLALEATGEVRITDNIDVSGKGFRGGSGSTLYGSGADALYDYRFDFSPFSRSGGKGEGVGRSIGNIIAQVPWIGRGPSISGGGGGNARGGGGGGGANGGAGGRGGFQGWPVTNTCLPSDVGGLGGISLWSPSPLGFPYSTVLPSDPHGESHRVFLGSGGGGGNLATDAGVVFPSRRAGSGGRGGGIVIIRASRIVGRGAGAELEPTYFLGAGGPPDTSFILADGDPGEEGTLAGGGGGGAGGSIVLSVPDLSVVGRLRLSVHGGIGGYAWSWDEQNLYCYGPGGGGGGGLIRHGPLSVTTATFDTSGGAAAWSALPDVGDGIDRCYQSDQHYGARGGNSGRLYIGGLALPGTPMSDMCLEPAGDRHLTVVTPIDRPVALVTDQLLVPLVRYRW